MIITDIVPQKHNNDRVSIFIDNEYTFSLDKLDALRNKLSIGRKLSEQEVQMLKIECVLSKAKAKAMDVISRKPVSKKELFDKLTDKGYDNEIASDVVCELEELGYVNDYDYTQLYLEYAKEKCYGIIKIRYELKQKGIGTDILNEFTNDVSLFAGTEEIIEVIDMKYKNINLTDIKEKQKAVRYFASRGFDFSTINEAFEIIKKRIEDE